MTTAQSSAQRSLRLFTKRPDAEGGTRGDYSEILKPFWKTKSVSAMEWEAMYGLRTGEFCITEDAKEADLAVLPLSWNHYLASKRLGDAALFVQAARSHGLPIVSYITGDEGVRVPSNFEDVWVLRASGCQSARRKRQIAQPVFFTDPICTIGISEEELIGRSVRDSGPIHRGLPAVGFCGQASVKPLKVALDLVRIVLRNFGFHLRLRLAEPQPLSSSSLLRAKALAHLNQSSKVTCNFIIRDKYRAGANSSADLQRTTREFYDNMMLSDYVLCVRGGGNFSKRFYEALAMGAVPLLLDTDCVLPLDDLIEWDKWIVRVPASELDRMDVALASHYHQVSGTGWADFRGRCRRLWKEHLTFGGFHRTAFSRILELSK